jgi:hypothetical protein
LKTWDFKQGLGTLLFAALWNLSAGLAASSLQLQVWKVDCSHSSDESVLEAISGAAKILAPSGIRLEADPIRPLASNAVWCGSVASEPGGTAMLTEMFRPLRLKNLRGLSLFILPTPAKARYSFSIIDESPDAGCGSPRDGETLSVTGAIFMTDFGLEQDANFSALLLAHEITHELTMKQHPTHAPRGSILADHVADFGPVIPASYCSCMQLSPFLRP